MRDVQRDAAAQQRMDEPALWGGRRDPMHAAQEQRMVRHDQTGTALDRLGDDRSDRVDREQDQLYRCVGVTADESDGVPRLCPAGRIELVETADDPGDAGHARSVVARQSLSSSVRARSGSGGLRMIASRVWATVWVAGP